MTHDETLLALAYEIVVDARACARCLADFRFSAAGRYQDHADELLKILAGLREVPPSEAQLMRIVWECIVHERVGWWHANEG